MTTRGSISETRSSMDAKVGSTAWASDGQNDAFINGIGGSVRVRPPMEPDELLVAGAARLLDRGDLPASVKRDLYTLKYQSRRVAANKSGFAVLVRAMSYVSNPAVALWFPRLIESEAYGRCSFPALTPDIAHESESHANHTTDLAQIRHRERRSPSTLDELLGALLVQECASRMLAASEASEMRVKSILVAR